MTTDRTGKPSNVLISLMVAAVLLLGALASILSHKADVNAYDSSSQVVAASESANVSPAAVPGAMKNPCKKDDLTCEASPYYYKELASERTDYWDASDYLVTQRWQNVSAVPSPPTLVSDWTGRQNISSIALAVSGAIMSIIAFLGGLLGIVVWFLTAIDFMDDMALVADRMVANIGGGFLGIDGNGLGAIGYFLIPAAILILIFAAVSFAPKFLGKLSGRQGATAGSASWSIVFVFAFLLVTTIQSSTNHNDTVQGNRDLSTVGAADFANSGTKGSDETQAALQATTGDYSNWAPGSLGWYVTGTRQIVNGAGGAFSTVVDDFSSATATAVGTDDVEQSNHEPCERYYAGMHNIFKNTPAAKGNPSATVMATQYDKLMYNLYFKPWAMANTGDSKSGRNSWCRIAEKEAEVPAGDQIFIASEAGMYGDLVTSLYQGNLSNGGGKWEKAPAGRAKAENIFGPYFLPVDGKEDKEAQDVGNTVYPIFWGACDWGGQGTNPAVGLNSEWSGVQKGEAPKGLKDSVKDKAGSVADKVTVTPGEVKDKAGDVKNKVTGDDKAAADKAKAEKDSKNVSSADCQSIIGDNSGAGLTGSSEKGVGSDALFFAEKEDNLQGYGWGGSSAYAKFAEAADVNGERPAFEYYRTISGDHPWETMGYAIMALFLGYLLLKNFAFIAIGGVFANFLGAFLLFIIAILLFLTFFPQVREYVKEVAYMIVAAMAVTFLITVIFGILFALVELYTALLSHLEMGNGMVQMLFYGLSVYMAFYSVRWLVERFTRLNMSSVKGQLAMGMAAGAPAFQRLGLDTISPLQGEFWSRDGSGGGDYRPNDAPVISDKDAAKEESSKVRGGSGDGVTKDGLLGDENGDVEQSKDKHKKNRDGRWDAAKIRNASAAGGSAVGALNAGAGAAVAGTGTALAGGVAAKHKAEDFKDKASEKMGDAKDKLDEKTRAAREAALDKGSRAAIWTNDLLSNDQSKHGGEDDTRAKTFFGKDISDDKLFGSGARSDQMKRAASAASLAQGASGPSADPRRIGVIDGDRVLDKFTGQQIGNRDPLTNKISMLDGLTSPYKIMDPETGSFIGSFNMDKMDAPGSFTGRPDKNLSHPGVDGPTLAENVTNGAPNLQDRWGTGLGYFAGASDPLMDANLPGTRPANTDAVMSAFGNKGQPNNPMNGTLQSPDADRTANMFRDYKDAAVMAAGGSLAASKLRSYAGGQSNGLADNEIVHATNAAWSLDNSSGLTMSPEDYLSTVESMGLADAQNVGIPQQGFNASGSTDDSPYAGFDGSMPNGAASDSSGGVGFASRDQINPEFSPFIGPDSDPGVVRAFQAMGDVGSPAPMQPAFVGADPGMSDQAIPSNVDPERMSALSFGNVALDSNRAQAIRQSTFDNAVTDAVINNAPNNFVSGEDLSALDSVKNESQARAWTARMSERTVGVVSSLAQKADLLDGDLDAGQKAEIRSQNRSQVVHEIKEVGSDILLEAIRSWGMKNSKT